MITVYVIAGAAASFTVLYLLLVLVDGCINESVYGIPREWKWERSRWRVIRTRRSSLVYLVRTGPRAFEEPQAVFWLGSKGHEERVAVQLARRANELGCTSMPSVRHLYGSPSPDQIDDLFERPQSFDLAEARHG